MAENAARRTDIGDGIRAWQEGMSALARAWSPTAPAAGAQAVEDGVNRLIAGLSELSSAQAAVAAGWLQLPLALASGNSNGVQNLQVGYGRLLQAYNGLFSAYIGAAAPVRQAVQAGVRSASTVAAETAQAESSAALNVATSASAHANGAAPPANGAANHAIEAAQAEQSDAAESASRPLGAGPIKGKIGRDGGRIYHLPGQANYDRFVADMLFSSEEEARAAGFRPSQR